jgi:hypothetical protein
MSIEEGLLIYAGIDAISLMSAACPIADDGKYARESQATAESGKEGVGNRL